MPGHAPNRGNLTPFTGEEGRKRASEAGKKSAALRKQRKQAAEAQTTTDATRAVAVIEQITSTLQRDQLGTAAFGAAALIVARITTGEIPIRHGADAAEVLRTLVDIARLEANEPTSLSVTARVTPEAIAELRRRATTNVTDVGATTETDTPPPTLEPTPPAPGDGHPLHI